MSDSAAKIIHDFLANPQDKRISVAFYKLCLHREVGYLKKGWSKGYGVPAHLYEPKTALIDYAVDIVGDILLKNKGNVHQALWDYYRNIQPDDPLSLPDNQLVAYFAIWLGRQIRQATSAILGWNNPQIRKLRRNIHQILESDAYSRGMRAEGEIIYLAANQSNLRMHLPLIPYNQLLSIVYQARQQTNTRTYTQWCHRIFEILNKFDDVANCLPFDDLVSAIVHTALDLAEYLAPRPGAMTSPRQEAIDRKFAEAKKYALEKVKANEIDHFRKNGKIDDFEADSFLKAAQIYLEDHINDGYRDKIPKYFRLIMPASYHKRYLDDYKYIFEEILNKGWQYFCDFLGNDPTIGEF